MPFSDIAPLDIGQIYPNEEEVLQDSDFLHVDDVNIRLKDRSSVDVFTPIQQITNFCSTISPQNEGMLNLQSMKDFNGVSE
jgi:hypothetical protein